MSDIANIARLQEERHAKAGEARALLDLVEAEARSLTAEEEQEFDARMSDVDALSKEIERRERLAALPYNNTILREADHTVEQSEPEIRGVGSQEYRDAFFSGLRKGFVGLTPEEKRDLSVGTNSAGGFTVPTDLETRIYEYARFQGAIQNVATTITTAAGNPLNIPTVGPTYGTSGWTAEAGSYTESDPAFGQVAMSAHTATHIAQVSEELLADNAINLEDLLARIMGENLYAIQETAFATGDGSSKPVGLFASTGTNTPAGSPNVGKRTASNSAITADELVDVFHLVSPPYRSRPNCAWLAADSTIAAIRKLKTGVSGDNTFLWQPGLQADQPDLLLGKPIYAHPNAPTIAVAANVIAFGDMSGYYIRRAGTVEIQRLNELYAASGQIGFRASVRVDGKMVDTNAVTVLGMKET
jgi:HK97 family phage major capsid protein